MAICKSALSVSLELFSQVTISVVGEVGRRLMQTYFEHEHGDSAIIHPEYDLDRAQSRKTPTRQRNNCGRRNWNQGSNRHGARPRYRHHTNSVASNDPLTFEQAPTYQPPFGLANHGYRTQLQNAQPYSPSPSMHTPPGHGLPYECDLRFDADIGSATRQALPGHTLQYGPHASIHLGSQASAGNTSAGYAPQFGHVHPVNPNIRPGHPPPSHQNHFGLDSPTIHAPMYGHHIGQLAPSHEPHVGRWPPVNLIDSPRHALPPRETHFGSVAPTLQPPVFNPRFGQEAPSNGSYFGHIPLTSQPAVYGHRFGPAAPYKEPHFRCSPQARAPPAPNPRFGRAPRYLPLGYAPPVRGSQFEHEQPHTRAQQAPQAHVFEVVSGGEYEHPPIQDPVYDWAS